MLTIVSILFNWGPAAPNIIVGSSMAPTLLPGDVRLLDRIYPQVSSIKRGDIVVFRYEGEQFTKRVYGLPGDSVYEVWLSGHDLAVMISPEIARRLSERPPTVLHVFQTTLREGDYYVIGDNVDCFDSRVFGPVPSSSIIGISRPMTINTIRTVITETSQMVLGMAGNFERAMFAESLPHVSTASSLRLPQTATVPSST